MRACYASALVATLKAVQLSAKQLVDQGLLVSLDQAIIVAATSKMDARVWTQWVRGAYLDVLAADALLVQKRTRLLGDFADAPLSPIGLSGGVGGGEVDKATTAMDVVRESVLWNIGYRHSAFVVDPSRDQMGAAHLAKLPEAILVHVMSAGSFEGLRNPATLLGRYSEPYHTTSASTSAEEPHLIREAERTRAQQQSDLTLKAYLERTYLIELSKWRMSPSDMVDSSDTVDSSRRLMSWWRETCEMLYRCIVQWDAEPMRFQCRPLHDLLHAEMSAFVGPPSGGGGEVEMRIIRDQLGLQGGLNGAEDLGHIPSPRAEVLSHLLSRVVEKVSGDRRVATVAATYVLENQKLREEVRVLSGTTSVAPTLLFTRAEHRRVELLRLLASEMPLQGTHQLRLYTTSADISLTQPTLEATDNEVDLLTQLHTVMDAEIPVGTNPLLVHWVKAPAVWAHLESIESIFTDNRAAALVLDGYLLTRLELYLGSPLTMDGGLRSRSGVMAMVKRAEAALAKWYQLPEDERDITMGMLLRDHATVSFYGMRSYSYRSTWTPRDVITQVDRMSSSLSSVEAWSHNKKSGVGGVDEECLRTASTSLRDPRLGSLLYPLLSPGRLSDLLDSFEAHTRDVREVLSRFSEPTVMSMLAANDDPSRMRWTIPALSASLVSSDLPPSTTTENVVYGRWDVPVGALLKNAFGQGSLSEPIAKLLAWKSLQSSVSGMATMTASLDAELLSANSISSPNAWQRLYTPPHHTASNDTKVNLLEVLWELYWKEWLSEPAVKLLEVLTTSGQVDLTHLDAAEKCWPPSCISMLAFGSRNTAPTEPEDLLLNADVLLTTGLAHAHTSLMNDVYPNGMDISKTLLSVYEGTNDTVPDWDLSENPMLAAALYTDENFMAKVVRAIRRTTTPSRGLSSVPMWGVY